MYTPFDSRKRLRESGCRVPALFTTVTSGAKRPDDQLRSPRLARHRSRMNIENRQAPSEVEVFDLGRNLTWDGLY